MADIVIDRSDAQIKTGIEKIADVSSSASEIDRNVDSKIIPKFNMSIIEDTLSIQAALDSGIKVYIPSDITVTINTITMSSGASLEVDGVLVLAEGQISAINITHKNVSLNGYGTIDGGDTSIFNTSAATEGSRIGVNVTTLTPIDLEDVNIRDITIKGFNNTGLYIGNTNSLSSYLQAASLISVKSSNNYRGFYFDDKADYISATLLSATNCHIGIDVKAGNDRIASSNFSNNFINCKLQDGVNEGHGAFSSCAFNHAKSGGYSLQANGINFGMVFEGCFFWYGDIELISCFGISIQNGQFSNININVNGGGAGIISGNMLHTNVTRTFTNFANVKWANNKYLSSNGDSTLFNLYREYYVLAQKFGGVNNTKGIDQPIYFKDTIEARRHGYQDVGNILVSNSRPFFSIAGSMDFDVQLMVRSHTGASDQMITLKVVIYTDTTLTTVYDTIQTSFFIPSLQTSYIPIKLNGIAKVLFGQMARVELTTGDISNGIDIQDIESTRLKVQSLD